MSAERRKRGACVVGKKAKSYRPEALLYLLNEVERELRQHGRVDAARLVNLSATAVSEDVTGGPGGRRWVM